MPGRHGQNARAARQAEAQDRAGRLGTLGDEPHVMNERPPMSDSPADREDWLDALLARNAADHADCYIADDGFTAAVVRALPPSLAVPAWRRRFVAGIWLMAAALLAIALPETALD